MLRKLTLAPVLLVGLTVSSPASAAQEGPPGLIFIEGGKTKIGSPIKETQALMAKFKTVANTLVGETPQHTVKVADFFLMPNEVTNEQYAAFVSATGHEPPYYWGAEAIDQGRRTFLEEQGKARQAAVAAGERPGPRESFDPAKWWKQSWTGLDWEIPEGRFDAPVNYVSFHDAQAYSDWAGLRLMTEIEYQRAARGDSDRVYPWGDDWDPDKSNSLEYKPMDTGMPVGSFEKGAVNGVFDLCANVWEWTDTKYRKYDKYKPLKVKIDNRETVEGLARFDPQKRVIVGGAYTAPGYGCRISVRQGTDRGQTTEALGFRCAADVTRGSVAARAVLDQEIELNVLPSDTDFNPVETSILHRWHTEKGTATIPGYAVITGYERTFFCPSAELAADNKNVLARISSEDGPVVLGFVTFGHPLMEPELDGGTYYVAWRGAAKLRGVEEAPDDAADGNAPADDAMDAQEPTFADVPGFVAEADCFFFYDLEFNPIIAWPATEIEFNRLKDSGSVRVEKFVPPTEKPDKDAPPHHSDGHAALLDGHPGPQTQGPVHGPRAEDRAGHVRR